LPKIVKYFRIATSVVVILMVSIFILSTSCEADWKKKNLGGGGDYNSIALDSLDNPHISYLDDSDPVNYILRHAFFDGRTWHKEIIDSGDVGWYSSIRVDSLDHIHISYRSDDPSYSLKYAFFDGLNWHNSIVESGGYSTSIAIDGNNRPHISHVTGSNELKYVRYDGNNWVSETLSQGLSLSGTTSLALTSTGAAYISFSDSSSPNRLYLATNVSGSWEVNSLADGRQSSLALDSLGNPHILFFSEGTQELVYNRFNGFAWITKSYQDVAVEATSIALDKYDHAHLSFGIYAYGLDFLVYGYHNGLDWFASLFERNSGYVTSIAVDGEGFPHIASRKRKGSASSSLGYFHYPGVMLKVSKRGKGSGTVMGSLDGISCGSACAANYMPTTSIVLTAQPDAGSTFTGWTKCPAPSENQCTVILEKNTKVKARFE
jgi:hypothetical protein